MKIALIGYGKMGQAIEHIALERGHEIVSIIEEHTLEEFDSDRFASADVAIEFTTPTTAVANYTKCFERHIPVVSGTTGWLSEWEQVTSLCKERQGGFFYASNFSIGVYLFNTISQQLARLMDSYPQYEVALTEIHHVHKKDHPSGTALTIAEGILSSLGRKERVYPYLETPSRPPLGDEIPLCCLREGEVPGTHTVEYSSPQDVISITHKALGRQGFALGAVLAAEFLRGRTGVYEMKDLMSF